ncbi:flagellar biosynthetic protein FliO [Aestuariibacter sp. GS-14]|uniref:flagellar biosynthetic protein FliO n=1 Tax=Aestuariibacter sp. GS-14 TaxID=2590670 RepID=UPI00112B45C6|nr:flagellar biosynthetic protein FliO [Aestuariibacter sp. GS-14]TPV61918.1 flagellar biosynthetic protein FliO [Aestuariibacter sp. GS-14]
MLLVKSKELKSSGKNLLKSVGYFVAPLTILLTPTANAAASITNPTSVLSIFLSLLLIVGIIFSLAYVMRRFNVTPGNSQHLKVVASLSAGARERVMVIQVGDEQHLIGVTAQNINHLSKLATPIVTQQHNPGGAMFKQKLVQAMAQKMNPSLKESGDDK